MWSQTARQNTRERSTLNSLISYKKELGYTQMSFLLSWLFLFFFFSVLTKKKKKLTNADFREWIIYMSHSHTVVMLRKLYLRRKEKSAMCLLTPSLLQCIFPAVKTQGVTAVCCQLTNHQSAPLETSSLWSLLQFVIYEVLYVRSVTYRCLYIIHTVYAVVILTITPPPTSVCMCRTARWIAGTTNPRQTAFESAKPPLCFKCIVSKWFFCLVLFLPQ